MSGIRQFRDGIMSAIDFSMDITREPDPKVDRVHLVLAGKFLSYKTCFPARRPARRALAGIIDWALERRRR
jgi:hypothetical protein